MRADWTMESNIQLILAALMPANRLACEISWATGWRIGDCLQLTTAAMRKAAADGGRLAIQEQKTGKRSSRKLPKSLVDRALSQAGAVYVFPGRLNGRKPRSRQAVYKDIRRAAVALRLSEHISPHSIRKSYAVDQYKKYGLSRVQKLLNHGNEAVTMIYAMADELSRRCQNPR